MENNPMPMLAVISALSTAFAGLLFVGYGQLARSIMENTNNTREILEIIRSSQAQLSSDWLLLQEEAFLGFRLAEHVLYSSSDLQFCRNHIILVIPKSGSLNAWFIVRRSWFIPLVEMTLYWSSRHRYNTYNVLISIGWQGWLGGDWSRLSFWKWLRLMDNQVIKKLSVHDKKHRKLT